MCHCLAKEDESSFLSLSIFSWCGKFLLLVLDKFVTSHAHPAHKHKARNDSNFAQLPDWYNLFYGICFPPSCASFYSPRKHSHIDSLNHSADVWIRWTHIEHTFGRITHMNGESFYFESFFAYFLSFSCDTIQNRL